MPNALATLLAASLTGTPAPPCAAMAGADALLTPGARVVVGEMHGNDATPRAVGELACLAARRGPVTVALEIPVKEQGGLDAYLASGGLPADRARLQATPFWTDPFQDGRRSEAMMGLLERLRKLRVGGAGVGVLAFDAGGPDRDRSMAEALARVFAAEPKRTFLALVGNLHARRTPGRFGRTFTVQVLAEQGVTLTSLKVRAGGSTWACSGGPETCGPMPLGSVSPRPLAVVREAVDEGAYDGWLDVGPATWSPPAAVSLTDRHRQVIARFGQRARAQAAYDARRFAECGPSFLAVASQGEGEVDLYNGACCFALAGQADAAFDALGRLPAGNTDAAELERDQDLASLRTDPRWAPLLARLRPDAGH